MTHVFVWTLRDVLGLGVLAIILLAMAVCGVIVFIENRRK